MTTWQLVLQCSYLMITVSVDCINKFILIVVLRGTLLWVRLCSSFFPVFQLVVKRVPHFLPSVENQLITRFSRSRHRFSDRRYRLDCRIVISLVLRKQVQARRPHFLFPSSCGLHHCRRYRVMRIKIRYTLTLSYQMQKQIRTERERFLEVDGFCLRQGEEGKRIVSWHGSRYTLFGRCRWRCRTVHQK